MSRLDRQLGEFEIDHRASPGIDETQARELGMPFSVPGGTSLRGVSLGCKHCGGVVMLNPDRTRARGYCQLCDAYICDICDKVRQDANYVHRNIDQLTDMVMSGRYALSGSSSSPVLTPINKE
jgi:hypothetical protein